MTTKKKAPNKETQKLRMEGDLTIYQAVGLKQYLLDALSHAQELELDLSSITAIDTAGLQLLMMLKRQSLKEGKQIRCAGHSPEVLEILDVYNVAAFFGDPLVITHV